MAPELIIVVVIAAALTLYAVLGGADFGAGVWEFNTALQATEKERNFIYKAVGPVWEANHVWLIFILVALHTAFPVAFAGLCRALWLPLLLAVVGIVYRGAAFVYRSSATPPPPPSKGGRGGSGAVRQQKLWGAVFAFASTAAPFFLGACLGAIASGDLPVTPEGDYHGNYLTGWITPFSIFTAFFAVGTCSYLAAVYLTREARQMGDAALVTLWRSRALANGAWMGILTAAGLTFIAVDIPSLWEGFREHAWPLVGLSALGGLFALWTLWTGRFTGSVAGAVVAVAAVVCGWVVAQSPAIVPPAITIATSKAPETVLWMMTWGIAAGAVLLIPSLAYLFYLFKGKRSALP